MSRISMIADNFIGRSSETDTNTGNYADEYEYIEWLLMEEYGDREYTEDELDELFEKYCNGYRLDEWRRRC